VHYHKRGERGLVAAPAIVTSVLIPEQGKLTLTVFPPRPRTNSCTQCAARPPR
jgi:hypothetical protein